MAAHGTIDDQLKGAVKMALQNTADLKSHQQTVEGLETRIDILEHDIKLREDQLEQLKRENQGLRNDFVVQQQAMDQLKVDMQADIQAIKVNAENANKGLREEFENKISKLLNTQKAQNTEFEEIKKCNEQ